MSSHLVQGYCPACGNADLVLLSYGSAVIKGSARGLGVLHCAHPDCSDPSATQRLLDAEPNPLHVMDIRPDGGWILQHPINERLNPEGLFACPVTLALNTKRSTIREITTRFANSRQHVKISDDGSLIVTPIPVDVDTLRSGGSYGPGRCETCGASDPLLAPPILKTEARHLQAGVPGERCSNVFHVANQRQTPGTPHFGPV